LGSLQKNTAGTILFYAFVRATGEDALGDAANITCKVSVDDGTRVELAAANVVELEDGFYRASYTAAESNGATVDFFPESSTSGVKVIVPHYNRFTSGGGGSGSATAALGYVPSTLFRYTGAGLVTGTNFLVDRLNYDSATKVWPVDADALRNHLQLDHTADDDIVYDIGGYLPAATADAENRGNVALIRQKRIQTIDWELIRAGLSGQQIYLSFGPVLSISAVNYLDADGASQVMATSGYRLLPDRQNVYFYGTMPILAEGPGSVWVEYEAGYGDTAAEVPSQWQNVVSQIAFRKYDFRGGDSGPSNDSYERMLDRMILVAGGTRRG
jgi:uncharacterized phiE125 gp8 family phage protein